MSSQQGMTYRDAGVDIDAGNRLVDRIKPAVKSTRRPEVLSGIGGFGGLMGLPSGYKEPVLISGTDGVGTKLKLAGQLDRHDGIGIDLVAMCVNDIVVHGAEPLFFLDYFATGALDVDQATRVIEGIAEGCRQAGCALLGGETAEMPGMYQAGDYDLAGFTVGVVERSEILDGSAVRNGDVILGLDSSGPHSNGYSLIRKVLEVSETDLSDEPELADALLAPTRIYVKPLLALLRETRVHSLAHITGGGLAENIIRMVPEGFTVEIDCSTWKWPEVFHWLQEQGQIADAEMLRTFNCGIGMVVILPESEVDSAASLLQGAGVASRVIGQVTAGAERIRFID